MKTTKVIVLVCFSGNLPGDPDGAAVALARQGFEVALMPERYRAMLDVPGDDFLEASKRVPGDITKDSDCDNLLDEAIKVHDEVEAIVGRFGGQCYECGPEDDDYVAEFCGLTELERSGWPPALHDA
jgi:hypothetical protein